MAVFDKLVSVIQGLTSAVKDNTRAIKRGGGPGGARGGLPGATGGAPGASGGRKARGGLAGRLGNVASLAKAAGPLALAAGGAAVAGSVASAVGKGVISATRGGDFGASLARTAVNAVSKIPFIGEFTGAAESVRVLEGAESDLNAATSQAARILGPGAITNAARELVGRRQVQENTNLELDRQVNANVVQGLEGGVVQRFAAHSGLGQAYLHMLHSGGAQSNQ